MSGNGVYQDLHQDKATEAKFECPRECVKYRKRGFKASPVSAWAAVAIHKPYGSGRG